MKSLKSFWLNFISYLSKLIKVLSLTLLSIYRAIGSAWLGGACRFEPSCSEYAVEAFHTHNFLSAFILVFKRVSRCRPGAGMGFDPVPSHNKTDCTHSCRGKNESR